MFCSLSGDVCRKKIFAIFTCQGRGWGSRNPPTSGGVLPWGVVGTPPHNLAQHRRASHPSLASGPPSRAQMAAIRSAWVSWSACHPQGGGLRVLWAGGCRSGCPWRKNRTFVCGWEQYHACQKIVRNNIFPHDQIHLHCVLQKKRIEGDMRQLAAPLPNSTRAVVHMVGRGSPESVFQDKSIPWPGHRAEVGRLEELVPLRGKLQLLGHLCRAQRSSRSPTA